VVNIGSSSAYAGFKGGTTYCASKHGLLGLSRALHAEIVAEGVRSYCISPGSIKTPMGRQVPDENYETFMTPEEVARYVAIVVSFDGEMAIEESRLSRVGERRRPPPS
jgi:NAD(P)-dependent dehydrogenase (short-subunit alcohol dehydrogenase family)